MLCQEIAVGIHTDVAEYQLNTLNQCPQTHDYGSADGVGAGQNEEQDGADQRNDQLYQPLAHVAQVKIMNAEHTQKESQQGSHESAAGLGVAQDEEGAAAIGAFSGTGLGFRAAVGSVVGAEAPDKVALGAGFIFFAQLDAAISAIHKVPTFRLV